MTVQEQIKDHIASLPEEKADDMEQLHKFILKRLPKTKQWFDSGKNEDNKTVTNPTIGYGQQTLTYANGKTKDFFQIGISANTTGISVYILGLKDKSYLKNTYAKQLGKASVTGYCIKFKSLKDIDVAVLGKAIKDGVEATR